MAGVGRLADHDDLLAVDAFGSRVGVRAAGGVVRLDLGAGRFEHLFVGGVRTQRLLVGQQVVTRVTVLHGDDVADGAQLLDPFEENDFHGSYRSEEHTSELQSLMRISYAVFCLKKKTHKPDTTSLLT